MIKKYYFKLKRKVINYLVKNDSGLYRPSSYPYISGDTFRKLADHIYDETKRVNPSNVKKNDIVFLNTSLISDFFEKVNPKIKNKYILITHNSDLNISSRDTKFIDEKIIHWFAQNLGIKKNSKISPLPIGLENLRYQNNGVIKDFKINTDNEKNKFILCSFNESTNHDKRNKVLEIAKRLEFVDIFKYSNHKNYIKNLNEYKFNLCPPGNGLDTHRIWESLLTKTIPILERSDFSMNLKDLNFPILILDKWEDLKDLNFHILKSLYFEITKDKNFVQIMMFDNWNKIFKSKV